MAYFMGAQSILYVCPTCPCGQQAKSRAECQRGSGTGREQTGQYCLFFIVWVFFCEITQHLFNHICGGHVFIKKGKNDRTQIFLLRL